MTTAVRQFKAYLYQVGYSASTQRMLPACVQEFLTHQPITGLSDIDPEQIKAFYEWLQIRPLQKRPGALSERMIGHYVYALKTFFTWLEVSGQLDYNPISGLKFKGVKPGNREPLGAAAIQELFTAATTLKDTALLHLFYSCGLRRSEGEALNIGDIHFKKQLLYVRLGKGAKRRVVPLTEKVAKALENYYLNERCSTVIKRVKDEAAFMLNQGGTRMKGDQYNEQLKRLTAKAGLPPDITLHHLRHSIATHLLQSGMHLEYVRDFLGHSCLETTQVYAKLSIIQLPLYDST